MENFDAWIGGLIVANMATVFAVLFGAGRIIWFAAKWDSRLGSVEKDVDAAHSSIRWIKDKILNQGGKT
jgi:hypothetical protein